ncbi:hypothetical protein N0V82_008700 [Gnomoniopsis sp. IMI 355080]|nr:hypothetical protein N0V82_008700 [Gnomoniopsis sp. IMI 355080]
MLPRLQSALRAFQASQKAFALIPDTATAPRKCNTLIILDSSFNPPTIAHMAMATSALHNLRTQRDIAGRLKGGDAAAAKTSKQQSSDDNDGVRLLLLLAVNNADKAPKPASFEQRLLLMQHFAADIQRAWREARAEDAEDELPVDIGLTTHPYFHDKSAAIAASPEYSFAPSSSEQVFLAGYDTLIRIFNPKYYTAAAEAPDDRTTTTPMQVALDPFLSRARLRITMRTDAEWGGRAEQEQFADSLSNGDELERVGGRREWATRVELVEGVEGSDGLVLSSTETRAAVEKEDWERLRRLVSPGVAGAIERKEVEW